MISRSVIALFCTGAPAALFAQSVELRSLDEFISVEGEIVGFNGVMVQVQTSVGAVSVPASDVICYGSACLSIVASNNFGLTADAFQGIVEQTIADVPAPADEAASSDDLTVAFGAPNLGTLYRTLAGAFAVTGQTNMGVDIDGTGQITLQSTTSDETAVLTISDGATEADIVVDTVSLNGTGTGVFAGPADWSSANRLGHQLLGLQAFSVIVAPNAGISEISMNDLARIYAGEVTNWSQLGGSDVSILPLQLPTTSPVYGEITKLVMEPAGKTVADNVLTMTDEAGIASAINQFPGSISIVNSAGANPEFTVDVAGACGIAVAPTTFNLISGDYALTRPVMATYNSPAETSLPAAFFDFAAGGVVQGLLEREGFINTTAMMQDPVVKNARLSALLGATLDDVQRAAAAQMFQSLFDADRLSVSMTGGAASGPEGAWNRAMMLDLAEALGDPALAGREVIFVGFGDSTSGSEAAVTASATAAADMLAAFQQVAPDVVSGGNFTLSSVGFGNVSPTTCYDGQVAGSQYTRVEVWVRQPS